MWYAVFFVGTFISLIGIIGVAVTEYPKVQERIERGKAIDAQIEQWRLEREALKR